MKRLSFILIIFLFFTLPSCAEQDLPSCREILNGIMQTEIGLPAGRIYSSAASECDEEYLSDQLINALYGNGSCPVMAEGWLDVAIFLPSSSHPCEFAVFLCDSEDTADDTARMLCSRLDLIRTAKENGKLSSYFETATITVMRNYVLLIVSSDTQNALNVASKIIK